MYGNAKYDIYLDILLMVSICVIYKLIVFLYVSELLWVCLYSFTLSNIVK